ncbi:MAG TPA: T9SS type A sorting domain-containing protein, partial [Paludibacter sp.]|nr:T9SS type A sorting domain-containing protein [Paludibacter sp.]
VIDAVEGESYSNNNFEADIATMTVSRQPTGLRGPTLQNIGLYPNPFDQEVVIAHAENCWLQVFNLEGVQVFTRQLTQTREAVRFDELPSGIYFFRLEKDGRTASFKAIKR